MGIAKINGIEPAKICGVDTGDFNKIVGVSSDMGHDANTLVLLHMDGLDGSTTFTDDTGRVWTSENGAALTTANKKYGTASYDLSDYSTGYIKSAISSDFSFGRYGPFTIEFFFRVAYKANYALFNMNDGTLNGIEINISADQYAIKLGPLTLSGNYSYNLDTWYHLALVKYAEGAFKLFFNGSSIHSGSTNGDIKCESELKIGWGKNGSFKGYMDEFRISNVSRYTSNFTPPTAPFTY